jgi:hypothetical protein
MDNREGYQAGKGLCYHYDNTGFATHCKIGVAYNDIETVRWREACYGENLSACPRYQAYTKEQYDEARAEMQRLLAVCRQWPDKYQGEENNG